MYFQSRDELKRLLDEHGAGAMAEGMIEHERPAIRIRSRPLDGEEPPLGASRFLGEPDLPESLEWPVDAAGVPLNFLAQINLAEAVGVLDDSPLPPDGHLLFFTRYDNPPWGFDPKDGPRFRVLHVPSSTKLHRRPLPNGAHFEEHKDREDLRRLMRFERVLTYPEPYHFEPMQSMDDDALFDLADAYKPGQGNEDPKYHMLGHAMLLQGPMEVEVQRVTNGIYMGGQSSDEDEARAEQLAPGAEDWIPLLQLDTDECFMWGDMGAIYFWIRKQDLAARDFSKTWMILQCG